MRVRLLWKLEDGEGDLAMGPAWIDTIGDDGQLRKSEEAVAGEWISQVQARELAAEHGWELVTDAGDDELGRPIGSIDAGAINGRLRDLGIAEEDLRVGERGSSLLGLWLERLPGIAPPQTVRVPGWGASIVRTGAISRTPDELRESLDLLAPGWRDE